MKRDYAIVRHAAARIGRAVNHVVLALREEEIPNEPSFTDQMLGAIRARMDGYGHKGIRWTATVLNPHTEEGKYGADFAGVVRINLPDYRVMKGFLAQAKLVEPEDSFSRREYTRLLRQCQQMLSYTPDSFVFLYSRKRVTVVPAIAITAADPCNPHEFYSRRITRFFEEHFESFIGDRKIHGTPKDLREMLERLRVLILTAGKADFDVMEDLTRSLGT